MSTPGTRVTTCPTCDPCGDTDVADVLTLNDANVVMLAPMDEARLHELRGSPTGSTCSTWTARSPAS